MLQKLFFETLEKHWKEERPFVVYRKPNGSVFKAILQESAEVYTTKDFSESGFVFAPFDNARDAILLHADKQLECEQAGTTAVGITQSETGLLKKEGSSSTKAKTEHVNLVQKALKLLESEELKKVVLSRKELIAVTAINSLDKFQKLSLRYPTAMVYCWYHPTVGLWLGATPETLVQIKKNSLRTMALAGTQPYNGTLDVVWGEKELQEQQLVTDTIVKGLSALATDIAVSELRTQRAGGIVHLRTDIKIDFEELVLQKILDILHPTPAVCGLPKEKAKNFILEHENYDREFYTGFLGELRLPAQSSNDKIETNLFVNLRCMQIQDQKGIIYVGGGITKASDPEKEWEETVKKTNTMKSVL